MYHGRGEIQLVTLHSLLFVPSDSQRKLAKSVDIAADALILDLEDSVTPEHKPAARELARVFLETPHTAGRAQLWVRINALNTQDSQLDLAAIVAARPYGLMVPKVDHPSELVKLGEDLDSLEAQAGIAVGATRLIPLLESSRGVLTVAEYLRTRLDRVSGISWGAQDLSASLGIRASRDPDGDWSFALRNAQVQCLWVARALKVDAIDTVTTDFKNLDALRADCVRSYSAGFTGKLAIHPDQVGVINGVFLPSPAELDHARCVIAAFASALGSGAVSLNGTMIDIAHLRAARRLLGSRETI
jgi:citrate lyase subunit beta / citryl-CoA lyase